MAGKTTKITENEEAAFKYTKSQLAEAGRYREKRDLVEALLEPGRTYTMAETDEIISNYMKGRVK